MYRLIQPLNRAHFSGLLLSGLIGLSWLGTAAFADDVAPEGELPLGPFVINDDAPESSVPSPEEANKHPLEMGYMMMSLTERGEAAARAGNHAKAAHYFLALAKGTSDVAVGFSKACEAFAAAGDDQLAIAACRDALGRDGVKASDYLRYAGLVLKQPAELKGARLEDFRAVLAQMQEKTADNPQALRMVKSLKCQLAVRLEDEGLLAGCVEAIKDYSPGDPEGLIFRSLLAFKQHRWSDAEKLITEAQKAGAPADVIQRSQESLEAQRAWVRQKTLDAALPYFASGAALLLALAGWWLLHGRRHLGGSSVQA